MNISEELNKAITEQMYIVGCGAWEEIYKVSQVVYDSINDIILVHYRKFQVIPGQYVFYYSKVRTNEFIWHEDQEGSFIKNDKVDWMDINKLNISDLVEEY